MKYYIDTEFHEYMKNGVNTIDLISIGIISEDGREYYAVCNEFDLDSAWKNNWLFDNVLLNIGNEINNHIIDKDIRDSNNLLSMKVVGKLKDYRELINQYGLPKSQIAKEMLRS